MNKRSASLVFVLVGLMGLTVSCSNGTGVAKISPPFSALDSGNTGERSPIGNTGRQSVGKTGGQLPIGDTDEQSRKRDTTGQSTIGGTGEQSAIGNTAGQSAIGNTGETTAIGDTSGRSSIDIENASILVGHWRKTTIIVDEPQDSHLVLEANGVGTSWDVMPSSRSSVTKGTWSVKGENIILQVEGNSVALPFTMHEGKLVLPNTPGERSFWEKID
jgi:hypothetical protein